MSPPVDPYLATSYSSNRMADASDDLVARCIEVRQRAYAPYSHFLVGAALLTDIGVFTGVNVENASYGLTICAERSAMVSAVSAGAREIRAVAVSSSIGVSPCGACRQCLREFARDECPVTCVDEHGEVKIRTTMKELLPFAFTPSHLQPQTPSS